MSGLRKEEPPGRRLTFDNPKTNLTFEKNLYLERAAGEAAHFFDNPKTNLTYEKNLYFSKTNIMPNHLCKDKS
jgi:hypothetical protein